MEKNIFDLIKVSFGDRIVDARPFDFTQDENGNFIKCSKAITTCPECGHGQEVYINDGDYDEPYQSVCENCGLGTYDVNDEDNNIHEDTYINENTDSPNNDIKITKNDDNGIKPLQSKIAISKKDEVEVLVSGCTFVDPIELGLIEIEEI